MGRVSSRAENQAEASRPLETPHGLSGGPTEGRDVGPRGVELQTFVLCVAEESGGAISKAWVLVCILLMTSLCILCLADLMSRIQIAGLKTRAWLKNTQNSVTRSKSLGGWSASFNMPIKMVLPKGAESTSMAVQWCCRFALAAWAPASAELCPELSAPKTNPAGTANT